MINSLKNIRTFHVTDKCNEACTDGITISRETKSPPQSQTRLANLGNSKEEAI